MSPDSRADKPRKPRGSKPGAKEGNRKFSRSRPGATRAKGNSNFPPKANRATVDDVSPFIKKLARLKSEKNRLEFSQFLLEGKKLIREVAEISPDIIMDVYVADNFNDPEFVDYLKDNRLRIKKITVAEMNHLSDVETPQGVIAQTRFANLRIDWARCQYVTLLDGVQDPGNLGSIFRTSLALGSQAIILGKGTCDPYNSKVVRSSASTFLSLPFEAGADLKSKVKFLRQKGFTILAATPRSPTPVNHPKLRKKVALIVGNEGSGIDPGLLSMADEEISIPQIKDVESLNVAVAHGILMYSIISGRSQ